MLSLSASDASAITIIASASSDVSEDMILKILRHVKDPKAVELATDARIQTLLKSGTSTRKLNSIRKKFAGILKVKRKEWDLFCKLEKIKMQKETEELRIHDLAFKCIQFVDKNGKSKILDRGGHKFSRWLHMAYNEDGLSIEFRYQDSPFSNGSQWVKVNVDGNLVFDIEGPAMGVRNQKVKTYVPGDWEKEVKEVNK